MAFSFGTQGSTPNPLSTGSLNLNTGNNSFSLGSTPQSRALSTATQSSSPSVPATGQKAPSLSNLGIGGSSTLGSSSGTGFQPVTAGLLSHAAPSTPVKSQTTTNVDGSSNTTTYHPPADTATVAPATTQSEATYVNPNATSQQINTGTAGTPLPPTSAPAPTPQPVSSNGNIVGQLQTTSANSSPTATAAEQATANAGLLNPALAQNAENIAQNYSNQIADVAKAGGGQGLGMLAGGAPNPIALGRAGAIFQNVTAEENQLTNAEQQALAGNAQGLTAANQQATAETEAGQLANTQQGQIQSGLGEAGSLANNLTPSPYGTPLINPASGAAFSGGQPLAPSGSGSNGAIQPNDPAYASLQQYAQLAANGEGSQIPSAWTSNPVINAQINSMAAQINPSYNPLTTPLNTSTQANTNAEIGSTNQTAAAATTQAISRIGNITSSLNNFLTQWGLNQTDSPFYNKPINTFLASTQGAGAEASWNLITSDLTAATSQLMSTPGITPTSFSAELQNFDPTNLQPSELNTYLAALSDAGQYQLNSYQTTASGAYGANSSTNLNTSPQPYVGTQTSANPPALPLPSNPAAAQQQNAPTPGKLLAGGALELGQGVSGILSALGGFALSFL